MARNRNRQTRPDPSSNASWLKQNQSLDSILYQEVKHRAYFSHYYQWLQEIAYQLYEWEGLDENVPENYIEMALHEYGTLGWVDSEKYGEIFVKGVGQNLGNYDVPTAFQASDRYYQDVSFPVYYFGRQNFPNSGLILNNRMGLVQSNGSNQTSIPIFKLYAEQLAFIKQISDINLNTQKTPFIVSFDDNLQMQEIQQLFAKVDGNVPVLFTRSVIDEKGSKKLGGQMADSLKVLDLKSPFLVDKLETQKQKIWDEAMARLGLMNIAQYKKERMTKTESEANVQQVWAVQNSMLKPRQEFCNLYNQLTGKSLSVKPSTQAIQTEGGTYSQGGEEE